MSARKFASIVIAVALASGVVAGCGDDDEGSDVAATDTAAATAPSTAAPTTRVTTEEQPPPQEPEQPTTEAAKPRDEIDKAAILRSLRRYAAFYNTGRYAEATRYLSDRAVEECGGPLATASALARLHSLDGINFRVVSVDPWNDGSRKADVSLIERIEGDDVPTELGFGPFVRERGRWVMDDEVFYPVGAQTFCE